MSKCGRHVDSDLPELQTTQIDTIGVNVQIYVTVRQWSSLICIDIPQIS